MSVAAITDEERRAVRALCERTLHGHGDDSRKPAEVLRWLASAVGEDDEADRYGTGELVERLERRVADLLGTPSAAFMPSGTMAQLAVLRVAAERSGRRGVAFHPTCHLELHESKAYQHLHGLHARLVGHPQRLIRLEDLEQVKETLGALVLELPQREIGGQLPEWDDLCAQVEWARGRGLWVHLDGARLWEAQTYYERPLAEICGLFDTVYVSFYKGLGGLAGCCLAGPQDVIDEARVWQARHGGRLVELYPYTLTAERGLDERLPRMPRYAAHARAIAAAVREVLGIRIVPDPPQVPMMHLLLAAPPDAVERAALEVARERRVWPIGRVTATLDDGLSRSELVIGDASLEVPADEAAALLAEVLERAQTLA